MNRASRRLLGATALAVVATLTGCDAGEVLSADDPDPDAATTSEPSADALQGALSLGETSEGETSTTVEGVVRGEGDESWTPAGEGYEWLSVTARTCVPGGASSTEVGWYQWAATGADGGWYPAAIDYDNARPTGQYPRRGEVTPGTCAEGRLLVAVPQQAEVVTLVNADENGVPQGTWLVGEAGVPTDLDAE